MSAQSADASTETKTRVVENLVAEEALASRYATVRTQSEYLCETLEVEDFCVQSMDDASPIKWHLAHVTWFFETFVLKPFVTDYQAYDPQFEYLFNSYYNGVGQPFPRPNRGDLSRPTVKEVYAYRAAIDEHILSLLGSGPIEEVTNRVILGLHHEQQHQELILTDLKHHFAQNPLLPAYRPALPRPRRHVTEMRFHPYQGGIVPIGAENQFCFDNELPRHDVLVQPFTFADRLVTNGEYLAFVQDGGYQTSSLWLSEGWSIVQTQGWRHPIYWLQQDGQWFEFTLHGQKPLDMDAPAVHISGHEAFAYANWADARLPTEFEWESVACQLEPTSAPSHCFVESGTYHPHGSEEHADEAPQAHCAREMFGQLWQWTSSSYGPYPGYKTLPGTLGEYNGKFMSSQLVLRGGSVATPRDHYRVSYRNFFYPPDRWQFSGIRLARDV